MIKIETGSDSIFFNLAAEEYYTSVLDEPFYMIWRTTPTLVSGRYQNIYSEVNLKYAEENKITVSRRKTGGGTVYADLGGVMYTKFYPHKKGTEISFAQCSDDIASAISALGVENVSYSGRNDLLANGFKICGNARMETDRGLLHHGSILFDVDLSKMESALMTPDGKLNSKGVKSVRSRVKNISSLTKDKITYSEFKNCLWNAVKTTGEINAQNDIASIKPLADFLASWDFIYGVNPAMDLTVQKRFSGGTVRVGVNVSHSVISDISFMGDFFYNGDISILTERLKGTKYDKAEILHVVECFGAFHNILPEELAELICGG